MNFGIAVSFSELEKEIIELDCLNMAAHFEAESSSFDPSIRFEGLRRELAAGAKIIQIRRESKLVAYLEYIPPVDGFFYVPSLQIHPESRGSSVLRPLLVQAAECLANFSLSVLRTRVHAQNFKSIRLHKKLGFSLLPSQDGRLHFEVTSAELSDALKVYCK